MVYKWKMPGLYDIPAQAAGEELDRIYEEKGELQARDVVNESRPETAPLHSLFEWNDPKAAELYRQQQARNIISCIVTVQDSEKSGPTQVRAFVHVAESYRPTQVVVSKKDLREELVRTALKDAETFQRRLETFSSLRPIKPLRRTLERTIQQLREESRP